MNDLLQGIRSSDRRSLARAITLAESTRHEDRAAAAALLDELAPQTGGAIRLGISGTPGVGKSSFIETLGAHLVEAGLRVAVLAVDPSSSRGRGAILGDKTRMQTLTRHPNAFIRPSPAGHSLGGVTAVTSDAVQLADAFGFDVILIETVGVGQSEVAVTSMTDLFLLLVAPGGGDDLQGIKRGVLEVADFIVVNKTDGDFRNQAFVTAADYRAALSMVRPRTGWPVADVLNCSSFDVDSIVAVWEVVSGRWTELHDNGKLEAARAIKRRELLAARVRHLLAELAAERTGASAATERAVVLGQRSIAGGATEILADILARHTPNVGST